MASIKKTSVFFLIIFSAFVSFFNAQAYRCFTEASCYWPNNYCCKTNEGNVCRYSCKGLSCDDDEDCAPREWCCKGECKTKVCREDVPSLSCDNDEDCASGEWCCKRKCKTRDCTEGLAGWLIAVIVIIVLSVLFSLGGYVYRSCYKP